ncbi:MAG: ECF transporter S component [Lachnospiraceae bacterium]|nr:ECF transporter S component [Lachnospiraceae bacterium]
MRKKGWYNGILLLLALFLLWYGVVVLRGQEYYYISWGILMLGLIGFFLRFEKSRPGAALLTMIAALCGVAIASRIAFFFLPQMKPVAAVVIIAGVAFGAEVGFVTGAVTMFVSNFYFMQGSWTPFQMFAMGLIGFFAGVLLRRREGAQPSGFSYKERIISALYGFFSVVILYGGIVELNTLFFTVQEPSVAAVFAVYLQGLPFNLLFGASTAVFLFFLYHPVLARLQRIQKKYRLIDKEEKT